MPISVKCGCGKGYKLTDAAAGKKFQCKACGEMVRVPAAVQSPPTAARKPTTPKPTAPKPAGGSPAGGAPGGPRRKPASSAPAGPAKARPARPARKPGASAGPPAEPVGALDYEDDFGGGFDDDFGDDFDDPPPRRSRTAPPAVGRSSRPRSQSRRPPQPERPTKKPAKKKKAKSDDDDEATPLGMLGGGLFFIALGVGGYFLFANLEQEGGSARVPALVALVYNIFGKTGILVIGVLLGLVMVGGAIAKFVNRD